MLQEGLSEEVKAMIAQRVNAEVRRRNVHHPIAVQLLFIVTTLFPLNDSRVMSRRWRPFARSWRTRSSRRSKKCAPKLRGCSEARRIDARARVGASVELSGKCVRAREFQQRVRAGLKGRSLGCVAHGGGGLGV